MLIGLNALVADDGAGGVEACSGFVLVDHVAPQVKERESARGCGDAADYPRGSDLDAGFRLPRLKVAGRPLVVWPGDGVGGEGRVDLTTRGLKADADQIGGQNGQDVAAIDAGDGHALPMVGVACDGTRPQVVGRSETPG